MELSSIRPELAPSFKTESSKLGEEEINILMAHAYWKIITLQKELAKQQVSTNLLSFYQDKNMDNENGFI
jgi:hypothetical protein